MRPEVLQNLLHRYVPGWDQSIIQTRQSLGFTFDQDGIQNWEWAISGNVEHVKESAISFTSEIGLPDEFANYWVCCFFSDYLTPDQPIDFAPIKGPPFFEVACPSDWAGDPWINSTTTGRLLVEANGSDWLQVDGGCQELGKSAEEEIGRLGMAPACAALWVCCSLPPDMKWLAKWGWRQGWSAWLSSPDSLDDFRCPYREGNRRVRAYPTVIDWGENSIGKGPHIAARAAAQRGIKFSTHSLPGQPLILSMEWNPALVGVNDLRRAVEHHQRTEGGRARIREEDTLTRLVKEHIHSAKQPLDSRKLDAVARFAAGEASFEQPLAEEALQPEFQDQWLKFIESGPPESRIRDYRRNLTKLVYNKVRKWLVAQGYRPKLGRGSTWRKDIFP